MRRHGSEIMDGGRRDRGRRWSCGRSSLREVKRRIRPLFTQERVAVSAGLFLDGLLGPERRKTGWMRAEAAGDPGPWRQQAILGRSHWDADALRDVVRDYALETLADAGRGAGDRRDRLSEAGQGLVRRRRGSTRARRARSPTARSACSPPTSRVTATPSSTGRCICPRPGPTTRPAWRRPMCPRRSALRPSRSWRVAMIERAIAAGVPFAWVAADSVYGVGEIEMALRRAGKGYVLGVNGTHRFHSWDASRAGRRHRRGRSPQALPASALACACRPAPGPRGRGCTTGPIWNWPTSRPTSSSTAAPVDLWTRGLLIRRSLARRRAAPTSRPGARPARRSRCWSRSKASAGRSRTVRDRQERARARPQRDPIAGMAGIGTSRW